LGTEWAQPHEVVASSAVKWFEIVVGVITAGASAGALFFAWRTVTEARRAADEARHDHAARRIEATVELVSKVRLANQAANHVGAGSFQERLRPLVALHRDDWPRTYELSGRKFTSDGYPEDDQLAAASLEELREAAKHLEKKL
jgi:hypothetical protein